MSVSNSEYGEATPHTGSLASAKAPPYGIHVDEYAHITDPDAGELTNPRGVTAPRTVYHNKVDLPRSPDQVDGKCSERYCNGVSNTKYKIEDASGIVKDGEEWAATNKVNSLTNTAGDCYRDSDCSFFYTDSRGKLSQEIVGRCVRRSSTQSECECIPPFFGRNCQLKHCPNATNNGLECGGPERGICDSSSGVCSCKTNVTTSLIVRDENGQDLTKFYGKACELRKCPNDCHVNGVRHGHCEQERDTQEHICRCFPAYYGSDCSKRRCPMSYRGYVCDDHGTCDMNTGKCNCAHGYSNADCSKKFGVHYNYYNQVKATTEPSTEVVQKPPAEHTQNKINYYNEWHTGGGPLGPPAPNPPPPPTP